MRKDILMKLRINPKGYKGKGTQEIIGEKDGKSKGTTNGTF